ncbi:phosphoribosyltransferase-like protein [Leisingera sp. ANG-Vp]|uniref:phosphoribosyltransferase-like protein n=1 Tax=Leisingera sp. ANG-Vp TaxID=1577896 RepID=UPI00126A12A7|nr:hypothetical protein [Leisingera sp. ANG-Vp]
MDEIDQLLGFDQDHPAAQLVDTFSSLKSRITILNARSWENKLRWKEVQSWLDNFDGKSGCCPETERLHALFLLSQFMYYGGREVRVLLKALYREMIVVPFVQRAREALGNTRDLHAIEPEFNRLLQQTRILGIGNPSESGPHLLYFFRQENSLSKDRFMGASEIVKAERAEGGAFSRSIRFPNVTDYFFIDDVCGSGETAKKFSESVLEEIIDMSGHGNIRFHYYCMFGTEGGMKAIRENTVFGRNSGAIYELDETFGALSESSRFLKNHPSDISPQTVRQICLHYGSLLWPGLPGGFDNNQLVLGFGHNTPDNTLPIFWGHPEHGAKIPWNPAFQRHWKYGY